MNTWINEYQQNWPNKHKVIPKKPTNQPKKANKQKQTNKQKKQPFSGFIKVNSKKARLFMEIFFPRTLSLNDFTLGFYTFILILFFISAKERSQLSHGSVLGRKWLIFVKRSKKCCVPFIKGLSLPTWHLELVGIRFPNNPHFESGTNYMHHAEVNHPQLPLWWAGGLKSCCSFPLSFSIRAF